MPRFLGNSTNNQSFEKFQNLKNIPPLNMYCNLGNFPNAWVYGKFPECLGIWEISQMPGFLENSLNIQSFEKFPKS